MIVADASAVLELLLNTKTGSRVARRFRDRGETLHAPHLLDVEVLQVLRRYARTRMLDEVRAEEALLDLMQLPIERYRHTALAERVWQLRQALTAYDAVYVALAEALDAPLVTCDSKLSRTTGHDAMIEVVR
jgi:predicted nucleic acid-binding protein